MKEKGQISSFFLSHRTLRSKLVLCASLIPFGTQQWLQLEFTLRKGQCAHSEGLRTKNSMKWCHQKSYYLPSLFSYLHPQAPFSFFLHFLSLPSFLLSSLPPFLPFSFPPSCFLYLRCKYLNNLHSVHLLHRWKILHVFFKKFPLFFLDLQIFLPMCTDTHVSGICPWQCMCTCKTLSILCMSIF